MRVSLRELVAGLFSRNKVLVRQTKVRVKVLLVKGRERIERMPIRLLKGQGRDDKTIYQGVVSFIDRAELFDFRGVLFDGGGLLSGGRLKLTFRGKADVISRQRENDVSRVVVGAEGNVSVSDLF